MGKEKNIKSLKNYIEERVVNLSSECFSLERPSTEILEELREKIFSKENAYWRICEKSPLSSDDCLQSFAIYIGPRNATVTLPLVQVVFAIVKTVKALDVGLLVGLRKSGMGSLDEDWVLRKKLLTDRLAVHLNHGKFCDELFEYLNSAYQELRSS